MTGPPGRPLRAGASVNDIMGGMFGAIGVLAALRERERTGRGQEIQSALFENCVFLAAQHMQQFAMTGEIRRRCRRASRPGSVYDVHAGRRRAALHRRGQRQAVHHLVQGAGPPGAGHPPRVRRQRRARGRAPATAGSAGAILRHHRAEDGLGWKRPGCPTRRSCARPVAGRPHLGGQRRAGADADGRRQRRPHCCCCC